MNSMYHFVMCVAPKYPFSNWCDFAVDSEDRRASITESTVEKHRLELDKFSFARIVLFRNRTHEYVY